MKRYFLPLFVALTALMGLSACGDDATVDEGQPLKVSFNLSTPIDGNQTRALGDPGEPELFLAPNYLYFFMVLNDTYVNYKVYTDLTWERSGDYYVSSEVSLDLQLRVDQLTSARAYMVASTQPLNFTQIPSAEGQTDWTENTVKNLIFLGEKDAVNNVLNLRDVYSTPALKKNNDGNYYVTGAIKQTSTETLVSFGTVTLYRIAAKVDFMWEASNHRQDFVMKSVQVTNAPTQGYCFLPAKNAKPASYSSEYTVTVLAPEQVNEGNKWEGRAYTYMLQPENFTLRYKVKCLDGSLTKNFEGQTDESTIQTAGQHDVYSSWYLVRFNLNDNN